MNSSATSTEENVNNGTTSSTEGELELQKCTMFVSKAALLEILTLTFVFT